MKIPFKSVITIILLVSFLRVNAQLDELSFGTDSAFEMITWNIEWFPNFGNTTADSVQLIIESLNADVYAIQEIDDTSLFRQTINNLESYELYIHEGWFGGLVYVYNSNNIVVNSIYEILDSNIYWHNLPRSPLVMELTYNNEDIIILNNHFKCCGDEVLDLADPEDEETRRYEASNLIKDYIDVNWNNERVIVTGDLNDMLTDVPDHNVFQVFIDDSLNYRFADMDIALAPSNTWSYPTWPSHLDHILVSNEFFEYLEDDNTVVECFQVEDQFAGGWSAYENLISDHRPVGIKMHISSTPNDIIDLLKINANIYPNPTDGSIQLDLGNFYENLELTLMDLSGKTVHASHHENTDRIVLNIEAPKGMYILVIETEEQRSISKVIKN